MYVKQHEGDLEQHLAGKTKSKHVSALDGLMSSATMVHDMLLKQWTNDLVALVNALTTFCPQWQTQEDKLLEDVELQKSLLANKHYGNIAPTVEHIKSMVKYVNVGLYVWRVAPRSRCARAPYGTRARVPNGTRASREARVF